MEQERQEVGQERQDVGQESWEVEQEVLCCSMWNAGSRCPRVTVASVHHRRTAGRRSGTGRGSSHHAGRRRSAPKHGRQSAGPPRPEHSSEVALVQDSRPARPGMNLCALTLRSQGGTRDDRPFSGPCRAPPVPPFKGLKGHRTVTYRSSLYCDDLDDPELVFNSSARHSSSNSLVLALIIWRFPQAQLFRGFDLDWSASTSYERQPSPVLILINLN